MMNGKPVNLKLKTFYADNWISVAVIYDQDQATKLIQYINTFIQQDTQIFLIEQVHYESDDLLSEALQSDVNYLNYNIITQENGRRKC